jgi:NADPH:quinone reductase-like Zn-dependent oxidoreductase
MFENMNKAIAQYRFVPTIDRVFDFNDAKAAYIYQQNSQHLGKIVIAASP